jgi:hypothetical protein
MTREEIANGLEEIAKGIREGKTIEQLYLGEWISGDLQHTIKNFRIKPEPKYIPFTADDWREFKRTRIKASNYSYSVVIESWDEDGLFTEGGMRIQYDSAFQDYVFADTNKPVGKEVQND